MSGVVYKSHIKEPKHETYQKATKEPIKEPHKSHAQKTFRRVIDKKPTQERFDNITSYVLIEWAHQDPFPCAQVKVPPF